MRHDPKWDAHEERLENMRIKCLLPTPHGRALAPWREFKEYTSVNDSQWPAEDRLATDYLRMISDRLA